MILSRYAAKECHDFARTEPSLEVLYDRKLEEICKDLAGTVKGEFRKTVKRYFHEAIDQIMIGKTEQFKDLLQPKDTDA